MLDAHVAFEVDRLTGPELEEDIRSVAASTLEWLRPQPLGAVLPAAEVAAAAGRAVAEIPLAEPLGEMVAELATAAQQALADRGVAVSNLVERQHLDSLVEVLAQMDEARREVLDIVVSSPAYSRLVAHVLYHGLKSYVLTENVFARKIPGASSLVKFGQRGLTSAAPGLEANVDRQLTAFVAANVADTLRESRRYLQTTVDGATLAELAGDAWAVLAPRPVPEPTQAAAQQRQALAEVGLAVVARWQQTGLLASLVESVVGDLLGRRADQPVGELLADLSLDTDGLARELAAGVGPALKSARDSGLLEQQVRARLAPFYQWWAEQPD